MPPRGGSGLTGLAVACAASSATSSSAPRAAWKRSGATRRATATRATTTRANVLLAAAAWTAWVWLTRMWNIARDTTPGHGPGFKLVHAVLALVSLAFAVALGVIGLRMRREAAR